MGLSLRKPRGQYEEGGYLKDNSPSCLATLICFQFAVAQVGKVRYNCEVSHLKGRDFPLRACIGNVFAFVA
jgi:hypothetical protein